MARDASPSDLLSIERAATDYMEAWLAGDPDRIRDHPDLTLRSVSTDAETGHRTVEISGYQEVLEAISARAGSTPSHEYGIRLLDAFSNIAAVEIESGSFVAFLHIGRFDDRWRIFEILSEPL